MRARVLGVLASSALVVAGLPALAATPAQALQAPAAFTATALETYQTDGIAWAVASAQGKVFVGGRFSHVRPAGATAGSGDPGEVARSNFVVLDAATGAPTSCQPGALLAGDPLTASVRSLAVSPDGSTLYVGGYFSTFGPSGAPSNRGSMAALDIASCTVVGFNPAPTGMVRAIAATSTVVYYGGDFVSVNTGGVITARQHAAAAVAVGENGAGSLLPWAPATTSTATAGTNPPVYVNSPSVHALNVKLDGSEVVLGGDFEKVNGVASHGIAAVDGTTGANVWVDNSLVPTSSSVKAIAVDATGFYTGNEGSGSGAFDGRLALDWTHTMRWRDTCLGATQAVVVYDDALYSGSHAHNCNSMGEYPDGARHHLLAETLTVDPTPPVAFGNTDPRPAKLAWFPDTNDGPSDKCAVSPLVWECIGPRSMAVAHTNAQDYMYVVGEFSSVNGAPQQGITRFGQTSDAAPSTPVVVATSSVPGQVRVAWRPSLDLDNTDLTYTLERSANGSAPWTTLQTSDQTSWFWDRPQMVYLDNGRTMGATYWYRVSVTDGVTTKTTVPKSATVTNVGTEPPGGGYGPSPYQAAVLADDPALYLRYDETGDVFLSDATANRSNVVLKGTATFGTGLVTSDASRAVTLSGGYGQTLYTQKREQPASGTSFGSFSLETWFATTSTRGGKIIGFGNKQDYSSNSFDKQVWITDTGKLAFGVVNGASKTVLSTDGVYNDGLRHHVVAVQDASAGMRLYVDGELLKSNTTKTSQAYTGYWHIGGDNLVSWSPAASYACPPVTDPTCASTSKTSFPFTGTLDETAVYHRALSLSDVQQHFGLADTAGTEVTELTPQPPTVSIGSPIDGDTVSGVVPVQVVGHTTSGTVSHPDTLQLLVNGAVAQSFTCPAGDDVYDCSTSFGWDTSGLGGTYSLTARITSTDAQTTTSAPAVSVKVPLPPTKPTAAITDPNAAQVVGPGVVTVHATASTVEGSVSFPAALELFVDGGATPVATVPCPGDAYDCAVDIPWTTTGRYGPHTLTVRATATEGCQAVPSSCTGNASAGVAVSVAAATATTITALKTVRTGTTVTVTGRVTVPLSGLGAPGVPVALTGTPAIGTPVVKALTTNSTGYFTATFAVANNTIFGARTTATGWYLASSTAVRQYVTGNLVCSLSATTVRAGVRDVMTCRMTGLPTQTAVAIQYAYAGTWRTLVKTTSRTGAAYMSFVFKAKGTWYLRGVIGSNKTYYTTIGTNLRLRVV